MQFSVLELIHEPSKFFIDSGADVCLIKLSNLKGDTQVFEDNCITLKGIDHNNLNPIKTIGYSYLNIKLQDKIISHKFHIVQDNFPISFNGLLGNDFLTRFNCIVDYENHCFSISKITIPLNHFQNSCSISTQNQEQNLNHNEIENFTQNSNSNNCFILKPRSETIVKIEITNGELSEGILPPTTILEGVYLCPSLVKVINKNYALTSILNTTEKSVKINKIALALEQIENHSNIRTFKTSSSSNSNSNRLKTITNLLRLDHLNQEEKDSIINICHEFNQIFHLEGDRLSSTNTVLHEIPVTSQIPINSKTYRYPEVHKDEVNKQITKMLEQNIIEPSTSPWNSPVWVVPKKMDASGEKKWRIVIDYRKLNEITIGDSYPLPNISDILDQLGHSKYFSVIDLTSGFHQIEMSPKDASKTAFSTPTGHYQFKRMPFGLKNSPASFQRLMNTVLAGIQNIKCFVYLDDIVVFADNLENHNKKLKEIFSRLSQFNLKIQPDKCEFLRKEVAYLGHIITEQGVKPCPEKIAAVLNFSTPKSPKEIKSFLGLAGYYRKFIPNFSKITLPLVKLLRKNVNYEWTSLQQSAFENLKLLLCSEPVLQYPDFTKEFYLTTDASNYAIGAVLSQNDPPNDLPIAYASRTLNKAESNYSTTEKELLAIIWSVKHFRPYLYGKKFTIITDHKPLTWLFNVKDPGSRLIRWRLALEEYEYEIKYKSGKTNVIADSLSRLPRENCENLSNVNSIEITNAQPNSDSYNEFLNKIQTTLITNDKLEEVGKKLIESSGNICLPMPLDLELTEPFQKDIIEKYTHLEKLKSHNSKLLDVIKLDISDKSIYYFFIKNFHWENASYETIFYSLNNLKSELIKNNVNTISLPRINFSFDKLSWNKIRSMIRYIFRDTNINIKIYHDILIHPKDEEIQIILKENHSNPTSGHSGYHRTYNRIKHQYKWPHMKKDIKNFIKTCESCQRNKLVRKKNIKPMEVSTTSSHPIEKIFLDIVGPLTLTEDGNKYILTLQDDLTKYSQAYALPNHEAITIATKLVENFICKFGIPTFIITDQGKDFMSDLLNQVSKLFKIKQINCTAYHPQSNGALERSHSTLADYLKHYINKDQTDWDKWLEFAMFSYNTTTHTSTKFTPHELMFGVKPNIPSSLLETPSFKYTYDNYLDELKLKLQKSHQIAKDNIIKSKETNKNYYDRKSNNVEFKVGQQVYLQNEQTSKGKSKKLTQNYNGPYKIHEINSPVNITILIKNKKVKVHANRLKPAFVSG